MATNTSNVNLTITDCYGGKTVKDLFILNDDIHKYDKVFIYNGKRVTDMSPEEKNQVSHRSQALELARQALNKHIENV